MADPRVVRDFRILGPLEVWAGGRTLHLGGPKPRTLLAVLLLHAGEAVSADRLIDELWGESPPRSARHLLHVYVSNLRRAGIHPLLSARAPGYALELGHDELDAGRFERLLGSGRRLLAAEQPAGAAQALREALALWRGDALADFTYEPFAQAEIARLGELRLAALEDRVEADLALGRHRELVGELEALVAASTLRERPRGQLMLALYRSGRQAEALEAYQQARRVLGEALGIEPSRPLRQLQQAILRHDPSLEPGAARDTAHLPAHAERKLVTVLAAAVTDTPALSALDPEGRRGAVAQALEPVTAALARHGAAVEALAGETVMAAFGIPAAHEDDALRAVRAAWQAREALVDANAELEREWGARVDVGFGVDRATSWRRRARDPLRSRARLRPARSA